MKLKGDWDSSSYDVGDVVRWTQNGEIHIAQKPCPAGVAPVDTLYWGLITGPLADAISMMCDIMNSVATVASSIPNNINDEGIVLKGTEDAEYLITVDDSGDTPELDVALIEGEASEGGDS